MGTGRNARAHHHLSIPPDPNLRGTHTADGPLTDCVETVAQRKQRRRFALLPFILYGVGRSIDVRNGEFRKRGPDVDTEHVH